MTPAKTHEERSTAPHSGPRASASKPSGVAFTPAGEDTRRSNGEFAHIGRGSNVPLLDGELIAERYQVIALVGEGGMGLVYHCRDRSNDAEVAVKRPILDADDGDVTHYCFMAEIRALTQMKHEHIVAAQSSGTDASGMPYLVMDWVPGVTLDRIPIYEFDYPLLWSIIDQVLGALTHAHARGIVHGDVKPANVMLEATGTGPRVRLLDFGLAWHFAGVLSHGGQQREVVWSPPNGAGTVGYMAPEQALGDADAIGPCTDLYALGCLAYRLLTGKAPRPWDLRSPCCQSSPAPTHLAVPTRGDIPARAVDFINKLLGYTPTGRAQSTADARAEWATHRPTASRPTLPLTAEMPSSRPGRRLAESPLFPTIAALAGW